MQTLSGLPSTQRDLNSILNIFFLDEFFKEEINARGFEKISKSYYLWVHRRSKMLTGAGTRRFISL